MNVKPSCALRIHPRGQRLRPATIANPSPFRYHFPMQPVGISPRNDLVFKDILSDKGRLLDFLNAVMAPITLVQVEIINPQLPKRMLELRGSILDIAATDEHGRQYQIEMQSIAHSYIGERVLFGWGGLYTTQLKKGETFASLRSAISIWLVESRKHPRIRFRHGYTFSRRRKAGRLFRRPTDAPLWRAQWMYCSAIAIMPRTTIVIGRGRSG